MHISETCELSCFQEQLHASELRAKDQAREQEEQSKEQAKQHQEAQQEWQEQWHVMQEQSHAMQMQLSETQAKLQNVESREMVSVETQRQVKPLPNKLEEKLREQLAKKDRLVRALRDAVKQLGALCRLTTSKTPLKAHHFPKESLCLPTIKAVVPRPVCLPSLRRSWLRRMDYSERYEPL
jgi:chromosome segregation ATPase